MSNAFKLLFLLAIASGLLTPNTATAQRTARSQSVYGGSIYNPVLRPSEPVYGQSKLRPHPGQVEIQPPPYRSRNETYRQALPPITTFREPYIIDVDGNHCKGFGRIFPLKRRRGDTFFLSVVPDNSPDVGLRQLGRTMVERNGSEHNIGGDSEMPAGYTFFAQFVDHDITFDTTSMLNIPIRDDELRNARTPDLDLDSIYGGGPEETPFLYNLPYLRVGDPIAIDGYGARFDLLRAPHSDRLGPRGGKARALIGDPRNDENFILAQLHAAFIAFHNRITDLIIERRYGPAREKYCRHQRHCDPRIISAALPPATKKKVFESARKHVIYYYHRLIVEDFLPRLIGERRVDDIFARGRDFYYPKGFGRYRSRSLFIPVEFAAAAFRYGHSQVRENYSLRSGIRKSLFDIAEGAGPRGGSPAFSPLRLDLLVDWRFFFEIDRQYPHGFNFARRIDPEITRSLHNLGAFNVVGRDDLTSLPARNLSRGRTLRLPSGQDVAQRVLAVLAKRGSLTIWGGHRAGRNGRSDWERFLLPPDRRTRRILGQGDTPLWYYVLQEAAIFGVRANSPSDSLILSRSPKSQRKRYAGITQVRFDGAQHQADRYVQDRYEDFQRDYGTLGHTLGPVGGTIVGEVLLGLIDNYHAKPDKGQRFHPEIRASLNPNPNAPLSLTAPRDYRNSRRPRYQMRNLLIDAGMAYPVRYSSYEKPRCDRSRYDPDCAQYSPPPIKRRQSRRYAPRRKRSHSSFVQDNPFWAD